MITVRYPKKTALPCFKKGRDAYKSKQDYVSHLPT
jgi:hypothetical protein